MTTRIAINGRGQRGESFTDVARRIGTINGVTIPADATDQQVNDLLWAQAGDDADRAEAALAEIQDIAENAEEAPSIANKANVDLGNLSSQSTARTNLGAGATGSTLFTAANAAAARATLSLGGAAVLNVGEAANTVAEGAYARTIADSRHLRPVVVDMHFGAMCGTGWVTGDPGNGSTQFQSTLTTAVTTSSQTMVLADATNFVAGQLITYKADDDEWYTVVIRSKSSNTLTLDRPCPAAAAIGSEVGAFFNDHNHPRQFGSYAIADYALRNLDYVWELAAEQKDWSAWRPWRPTGSITLPTLTQYTTLNYKNPGSDLTFLNAAQVTGNGQYAGAASLPVELPAGPTRAVVRINPGYIDAATDTANTVRVYVAIETEPGQDLYPVGSVDLTGFDGVQTVNIDFGMPPGTRCYVIAQNMSTGTYFFWLGGVSFYRRVGAPLDLNRGKAVFLGDSWFDNPWIIDRFEERLPDLTIVRAGNTGDKASDLLLRFNTDVAAEAPDIVFINVSTNDYANSVRRLKLSSEIQQLCQRCIDIGAQPILFNSTVGDAADGSQLQVSRGYACDLNYHEIGVGNQAEIITGGTTKLTVPAGARVPLIVSPFFMTKSAVIRHLGIKASATSLNVLAGYSGTMEPSSTMEDEVAWATTDLTVVDRVLEKVASTNQRYLVIAALNTSGADQTVTVTARIEATRS